MEQGEHLDRRNAILIEKGLRRSVGGDGSNQYVSNGETISPLLKAANPKTTAQVAADMGLSERSAQQRVQIARNLIPEVKELIRETAVADSTTQLLDLARMKPTQQTEVAKAIATGKVESVTEAKRELKEHEREQVREQNRMLVARSSVFADVWLCLPAGQ